MGKFYLKKLGHNELGSVVDGRGPQRGRFLLISKKAVSQGFFPTLSTVQTNDNAILPVINMNLNKKVYCNFVYHNDKITKKQANGRDEYRFYLNNDIENNELYFEKGDIVIFMARTNKEENEYQKIYFVKRIPKESEQYDLVDEILLKNNVGGGHALFEGDIFNLEEEVINYDLSNVKTEISNEVVEQINSSEKSIESLFTTSVFRDFVMTGYCRKCAITGNSIEYNELLNLEAAHIHPRAHGEINLPSNGIAMSRDIHWAFDKGFFTINDDYTVKVHEDIKSEYLNQYNGKKIFLPENDFFRPSKEFLKYHRDNIYGMFKYTGSIRRITN